MSTEKKETKLNPFEQSIKDYLDKRAAEDELFAVTYAKANKTLKECCNYVMKCAKEGKREGYADEEVFGWAVHYYDEDNIKNIPTTPGKVVVNKEIKLSETEMAEARATAIERFIEDEKKKVKLDYKVELSEEDKAEAREKAIELAVEDARKKMLDKKKAKAKATPVPATTDGEVPEAKNEEETVGQGSLF